MTTALARRSIRLTVADDAPLEVQAVKFDPDRIQTIRRECPGLDALTDEELTSLAMCFHDETGQFAGIFFIGPGGRACSFGEPDKAAAVRILRERIEGDLNGVGRGYAQMVERYVRAMRR